MPLRKAIEFLDRLNGMASEAEINLALREALTPWNIEHFCFVRYPQDDQRLEDVTLTRYVPATWLDHYRKKNYLRVDAGLRFAAQMFLPFKYLDAPDPQGEARELVSDLVAYGLANAVMVPVNGIPCIKGAVWLQGNDLEPHPQAILHTVVSYAFHRLGTKFYKAPPRLLSAREIETLAWAAAGKSAWETGEILRITQRTVEEHLASAIRKLGATNRAQAIAIALRDRIISF